MSNIVGNVSKNSTYLAVLTARVELDRAHPLHHGVKMQAHHIISAKGVKISDLGSKLVELGYNINALKNLLFLPSTLQGACHLRVQPHRGDHSTASDRDGNAYDDDDHPLSYHDLIAKRLKSLEGILLKICDGKAETASIVQRELDQLSQVIASLIHRQPAKARLTRVADSFVSGHSTGCAGTDSVPTHISSAKCPVSRDHLGKQGPNQRKEDITFKATTEYAVRPGN